MGIKYVTVNGNRKSSNENIYRNTYKHTYIIITIIIKIKIEYNTLASVPASSFANVDNLLNGLLFPLHIEHEREHK